MKAMLFQALPAFFIAALASHVSHAMTCDGGTVAEGATKVHVLMRCGQPTFIDQRQEERIRRVSDYEVVKERVVIEEWVYDFGTDRLIEKLTFRNSVLVQIEHGSYGVGDALTREPISLDNRLILSGESKYDVLVKFGRPSFQDQRVVEEVLRLKNGEIEIREVVVDEWIYDRGPGRLIRSVLFRNGKVWEIKDEGYPPQ
ncbi:MAG: DUF2845 domain-containing protein [Myxococcota bacterium]|nr:DUF2845 domain-containing protein [Myxococcota bacterium]